MLSTYIRVPHGQDPKTTALTEILWSAQKKHVFLARPIDLTITPISRGVSQLSELMALAPDEGHDAYRVDSETTPCPHT
jgi:hypothetical protein